MFRKYLQYFGKLYINKVNVYLNMNLFSLSRKLFSTFFFGNDFLSQNL